VDNRAEYWPSQTSAPDFAVGITEVCDIDGFTVTSGYAVKRVVGRHVKSLPFVSSQGCTMTCMHRLLAFDDNKLPSYFDPLVDSDPIISETQLMVKRL
jgi:hypothetical protein